MSALPHYLLCVVKNQFGPLVQQVVSALLTHGPLTLPSLIHYSSLTPSLARKSLLICLQNNIVVADYESRHIPSSTSSSSPPPSTLSTPRASADSPTGNGAQADTANDVRVLYRVHEASLRCRSRYPSYVQRVKMRLGEDAALLIQCLCLKGILTTQQLIDHALSIQQQQSPTTTTSPPAPASSSSPSSSAPGPSPQRNQLEEALLLLSSCRYIRRAIMAKASEGTDASGEGADEEKEFLSEAELKKRRREGEKKERAKRSPDESKEEKKTKGRGRKKKDAGDEEKEQREAELALQLQRDEEEEERRRQRQVDSGIPDHWVLNDSTFTVETQRDALLSYVRERVSPTSAFVLTALLRNHPYETARPPVYEEAQVMDAVAKYGRTVASPPKVTSASLHTLLVELTMGASHLLQSHGPTSFSFDFPSFLSHLQMLQTQSILSSHFSLLASRIYRVLLVHTRLEESQLAELCTASRQSVRESLHRLMKEEWVCLYEVPRTVDRAPSKTFFLWGVDRGKVKERVRELMYVSAVKAMEREGKEKDEVADVMGKVDMQQRIGELDRAKVERWKVGHERLQMAQKKIQDMLAIWEE